jgi:hypothetical protein
MIDLVRGCIESSRLKDPLGTLKAPSALVFGVLLGSFEFRIDEFPDTAVGRADVL